MTHRAHTVVALAASLMLGGAAFAEGGSSPGSDKPQAHQGHQSQMGQSGEQVERQVQQQLQQFAQDPNTATDKLFVLHAAMGNQFEIALAREAQQKAQNPQVKDLAQRILNDHQQAQQKLQPVAQELGVQLPQGLPREKEQELRIYSSLPADRFEKEYVAMMQADHAKDVNQFQACSQLSQNDAVKRYAQETLPKLQEHWHLTEQAAVALGISTGSMNEAMPASGRMGASGSMTGSSRSDINSSNTSGSSSNTNDTKRRPGEMTGGGPGSAGDSSPTPNTGTGGK